MEMRKSQGEDYKRPAGSASEESSRGDLLQRNETPPPQSPLKKRQKIDHLNMPSQNSDAESHHEHEDTAKLSACGLSSGKNSQENSSGSDRCENEEISVAQVLTNMTGSKNVRFADVCI